MDTIEKVTSLSKPRISEEERRKMEESGITVIEDEDVYWVMEWGPNNKMVLEGKREEKELVFEPEQAIARLLAEEVIYMRSDKEKKMFRFVVNCNDIFAWACADYEPLEYHEVQSLYDMYLEDWGWGAAKWCCIKRNEKPQGPVIEAMKKSGSWDEKMESLGKNVTDNQVQAMFAYAAQQLKTQSK